MCRCTNSWLPVPWKKKIEEILRQKSLMAGTFIRSGEDWLTELSTSRIRELVKLER